MKLVKTLWAPGLLLLTAVLGLSAIGADPDPDPAARDGRVVILGFDGADARTINELMAADPSGFPAFRKLRAEGTFEPLVVETPAESPVSWASLNSGQNPAKTGVPGFIKRTLTSGTPLPGFGYLEKDTRSVDELAHLPIPTWSPAVFAGVAGGAGFCVVLLLGLLALRGRFVVPLVLAVLVGGVAGWGGYTARGFLPSEYPVTKNVMEARNLWDHAAEAGVAAVVLDAAQAWDMPAPEGARVLAGLGLPDARGELGEWSIFTTDPDEFQRGGRGTTTAGTVYRVDREGDQILSRVVGPPNFWLEQKLQAELDALRLAQQSPSITLERSVELTTRTGDLEQQLKDARKDRTSTPLAIRFIGDRVAVTLGDQEQTLGVGEWSEFFDVTFAMNPLLKVSALTRVRIVQVEPHFEMFLNVLDIDPRNPPFWQPISQPHEFAAELAHECGPYETYGWPTLTMPFKDGEIEPEIMLEDVEFNMEWRQRLTDSILAKDDWRLFFTVFSTTDRVQHMMYQYYDEAHPLYDAEVAGRTTEFFGETIQLKEAIPAIYRQMDRVVGRVLDQLDPADTLMVVSDHGFQSFRRQVHLNNWLVEEGFLTLKPGVTKAKAKALQFVDWNETQAYSLGLGFIYLNLEGREPNGIVTGEEAPALLAKIRERLLEATDPDTGAKLCKEVYDVRKIHDGGFLEREADLITGFAAPYRIGWTTSGGGLSMVVDDKSGLEVLGPICSDNDSNWSGGHVSMALSEIGGVFFSNKKIAVPASGARALHVAPTALELLGVPIPKEMDLPALVVQ